MFARRSGGVTLLELIVFIVIVGIGMAGIFAVYNTIIAASADPQVRKQVLAIAESLLEEIQLMPFTYCDPDDANAATATSAAGCATLSESGVGAEGSESRYSSVIPFDNVNDFHGFNMSGIRTMDDVAVAGLEGYQATVSVVQAGLGPGTPSDLHDEIPGAAALRIAVTVTGPGSPPPSITLEGYRTRYAPTSLP